MPPPTISEEWRQTFLHCDFTNPFGCIGSSPGGPQDLHFLHLVGPFLVVHELASHSYGLAALRLESCCPARDRTCVPCKMGFLTLDHQAIPMTAVFISAPVLEARKHFFSLKGQIVSILGFVGQRVLSLQ